MDMLAMRIESGRAEVVRMPMPEAPRGWALLRTRLVGICNTDVELLRGYYGFAGVPGHEFTAEVVRAEVRPGLVGKRVTAEINVGCGTCVACMGGDARHCEARRVLGIKGLSGAMAEYVAVPVGNVLELPEGLTDEVAVFAEPLAAALRTAEMVAFRESSRVAVLGDGKLGLLCALSLREFSPDMTLIGRHGGKLEVARKAGVEVVLSERGESGAELAGRTGKFDIVVEATGSPEGLGVALELVKPLGTIAAKTTSHAPSALDLARLVVNEVRLVGSRCGRFAPALEMLSRGVLDPGALVEGIYPGARAVEAMEAAMRPGAGKILVDWR